MTLNEKIKDSVQKTTGIRCYEGVPPDGVVGRFAYFFPLRSGAAQRYNEVAIFFMERPVFSPLNPEKATNDCRYLALNWLNGLYAYSGLKFQDILSQNNTRDDFGGYGVGLRLVLVDEARHTGGGAVVDNHNYLRITCGIKNGIEVAWRGTYPSIEYRSVGDTVWTDFTESISLLPAEAIEFRLKEGATWTATSNNKHFNITSADSGGWGYAILSGNIMSLVDPTCESTTIPINGCFEALFTNCVVQEVDELQLPATTLTEGCYASMFYGCSKLYEVPELPATTLAADCYFTMFMNTGVRTTPALPATTLASRCYYRMFEGCTQLMTVTSLPATTLATECYYGMFYGCSRLYEVPELPATTLTTSCYDSMFRNCSSLQSITVAFTSWNITNTNNWVNGVAASGTFNCPDALPIEHGDSKIPNGWRVVKPTMYTVTARSNDAEMGHVSGGGSYAVGDTVTLTATAEEGNEFVNWTVSGSEVSTTNPYTFTVSQNTTVIGNFEEVRLNYLTFTALEDNSSVGWYASTYPNLEYSTDGSTWTAFTEPVSVSTGGKVMFRNNGTAWTGAPQYNVNTYFTTVGTFNLSGNIMSLVDATLETTTISVDRCFQMLFHNCGIVSAGGLDLSQAILAYYCYASMFSGCTSLTVAPALPATTLAQACYRYMFSGCTSLTVAPALPATTVNENCYEGMFSGCTALTTAPELPATTTIKTCYNKMFNNCSNISSIRVKFTVWVGSNEYNGATYEWVNGVAAGGDFYCPSGLPSISGTSRIPSGWTRHNID